MWTLTRNLMLAALVLVMLAAPAHAQNADPLAAGTTSGLYAIMRVTPDVLASRASFEYADFAAAWALLPPDADANTRLMAAPLLRDLTSLAAAPDQSSTVNGFDFFALERAAQIGLPPENGLILQHAAFDRAQIDAALTGRGYSAQSYFGLEGWCGEAGCDQGGQIELGNRVPGDAFSGGVGYRPPIALSADGRTLFFSPDLGTQEVIGAAVNGELDSMADAPEYRAILAAVSAFAPADARVRAAHLINPQDLLIGDPLAALPSAGGTASPPADALPLIGVPDAALIVDWANADGQTAAVILAYRDSAAAAAAGERALARLDTKAFRSDVVVTYAAVIADRGGVTGAPQVIESADGAAVVIPFTYPLPAADEPPYAVYAALRDMAFARDMAWLAAE
ncbi:MAG: hypothetical protein SF162_20140 [bacterium]|nr:hypothetical protein [bacterium]